MSICDVLKEIKAEVAKMGPPLESIRLTQSQWDAMVEIVF